jgi:uncharacterized protein YecT (DUF1311 family)
MSKSRASWVILVTLLAASAGATAQTAKADPCEKAASQADMNDCYGKQYQKDDARLNRIYHKAMEYLQHDLAQAGSDQAQKQSAQTAIDDLKSAELAWIKYRDLQCEAASQQYQGGTMASMIHSMCMSMATDHRIDEIKQAYENGDRKLE